MSPSELAEPQKLIPEILQPEMSNLDPETIAVYIHSATKVFGYWAAELAERWSDDDLPQVKGIVDLILTRVSEFVGSPHVEVQERVSAVPSASIVCIVSMLSHRLQTHSNCSRSSTPTSDHSNPNRNTPMMADPRLTHSARRSPGTPKVFI